MNVIKPFVIELNVWLKSKKSIEDKLRRQAKRYNKTYPREILYVDTKCLPLLKNETKQQTRECLFVGIDDFSRELYAGIYPDKSQFSSAQFLQNDVLAQCPYTIECVYSDNGREYQGTSEHLFVKTCNNHRINQKFIPPPCPQTNGKTEKSDTNFKLRYGIISKYLAIQKIENKNLNALLIFIIPLNRIKRFQGKRLMSF
ncbi:DDE-type integrase/transposase/recombinase [Gilliamella sp. Gris1-4]|uniref:DDE-type integrase/transposase/recombinase n=1 Tax=Gilliamella sp. Gris1-4 TaxID=3120244 RepID=UPI001C3FFAAC|nr:DDE-type integrase/transposase/recombinase [Gilliamella apicola]